MNKVFIINGSGYSGKDTFVKLFNKNTESTVFNISTVDNIRDCLTTLGYKFDKMIPESRKLMCDIKEFLVKYDDIPFKFVVSEYETYSNFMNDFVLFIHCREPEEIDKFKKYFGDICNTLLIRRKGIDVPDNKADMGVENYDYDFIVDNPADSRLTKKSSLSKYEKIIKEFIVDTGVI